MLEYGFNAQQIIEEGRISKEEIEEIRRWIKTQTVPEINDEQIVNFVISCDRDLDLTKKTIGEFYKTRERNKELFNNRSLSDDDVKSQLEVLEFIYLPKRTKSGEALIYHRLSDTTYWKYKMGPAMKLLFMTVDAAVYKGPPTGLIILFDMKGVSLLHLTRVKLGLIKAFSHYCQEALPAKLNAIHVLNTQYFIDKVMAIFKPFLKPEIYAMLHFHPTSPTWDEFHETYVEKDCLPLELGGNLKSTVELHLENNKLLAEMEGFFRDEENQRNEYYNRNC